jgi:hypothetical protein
LISASVWAVPGGSLKSESQEVVDFGADTITGIDFSVQRQHQIFQDSSADVDTVSLLPYLQTGNWLFTLDLPWQHAHGEYFVISEQLSPRLVCRASSTFLQNHPRIARYVSNNCQPTTTTNTAINDVSGMGDISGFAHYGRPLDNRGIWLGSVGLGYQADSGDVDKGLGSGMRNVMLEGSADVKIGKFSAIGVAGYTWIIGGPASQGTNTYAYVSLDLRYRVVQWVTLGAAWDFQQAYVPGGDDVLAATASIGFRALEKLRLRFYAKDYLDVATYPDREYGAYVTWSF